jgi:hypothetical protein
MQPRRELLAEKLMDVANIAVAALIFGQFVSGQPFRVDLGILAIVLWAFIYCVSYFYLCKGRE